MGSKDDKKIKISFSGVGIDFNQNKAIENFEKSLKTGKKKVNPFFNESEYNTKKENEKILLLKENKKKDEIEKKEKDSSRILKTDEEKKAEIKMLLDKRREFKIENEKKKKENKNTNLANKFRKNGRGFNFDHGKTGASGYAIKGAKNMFVDLNDSEIDEALGNVINVKQSFLKPATHTMSKFKKTRQNSGFKVYGGQVVRTIELTESGIVVSDLANQMSVKAKELLKILNKVGIKVKSGTILDTDTAQLIAEENGHKVVRIIEDAIEREFIETIKSTQSDEVARPPIVAIMGHVDHGKTSLLDYIRKSRLTSKEAGGITQSIGAYQIEHNGSKITFIDTPGHEAFIKMRSRGAKITDISIIVIAADDGIKPQTIEAIKHARQFGTQIIIAISKIDKPEADIQRVKNSLLEHNLVPEDLGGDTMVVPLSAITGEGIDKLLEAILFSAEMMELKGSSEGQADGVVIESKIDKQRGVLASVIVKNSFLKQGDFVVCGTCFGKVKTMTDANKQILKDAGLSTPVEILGFDNPPESGDFFYVVKKEKDAIALIEYRKDKAKEKHLDSKIAITKQAALAAFKNAIATDEEQKVLNLLVKSDTQGSLEAIVEMLSNLKTDKVKLKIVSSKAGAISKADITLAKSTNAEIIGFNVFCISKDVEKLAHSEGIKIETSDIIYKLVDCVKTKLENALKSAFEEVIVGKAEIRAIFNFKRIKVVGCYVRDGKMLNKIKCRVKRGEEIVLETEVENLKHLKDNVKEMAKGYECGVCLKDNTGIKIGDIIECFELKERK